MTNPDDRSFDLAWPAEDDPDSDGSLAGEEADLEIRNLWAPEADTYDGAPNDEAMLDGAVDDETVADELDEADEIVADEPEESLEVSREQPLLTLRVRLASSAGRSSERRAPRI